MYTDSTPEGWFGNGGAKHRAVNPISRLDYSSNKI